jgi:hypothetical protein
VRVTALRASANGGQDSRREQRRQQQERPGSHCMQVYVTAAAGDLSMCYLRACRLP